MIYIKINHSIGQPKVTNIGPFDRIDSANEFAATYLKNKPFNFLVMEFEPKPLKDPVEYVKGMKK